MGRYTDKNMRRQAGKVNGTRRERQLARQLRRDTNGVFGKLEGRAYNARVPGTTAHYKVEED